MIGNLFFFSSGADKTIGPHLSGAYVGGFGTAPDLKGKNVTKYKKILDKWFNKYPPLAGKASDHAADGFTFNYYANTWALMKALNEVKGNISGGQKALQSALRKVVLPDAAYGKLFLGKNNQALQQQYSYRMDVICPGRDRGRDGAEGRAIRRRDLRRHGSEAAEPDLSDVRPQEAPVDGQGTSSRQRSRQVTG